MCSKDMKRVLIMVGTRRLTQLKLEETGILAKSTFAAKNHLFACHTEHDLYLCELMQLPGDSECNTKFILYDFNAKTFGFPLKETFSCLAQLPANIMVNNRVWQQTLFLTENLEVRGALLSQDQKNFVYVASGTKIKPMQSQSIPFISKYPLIAFKSPKPTNRELMLTSLVRPDQILCLDIGQWQFITFIEENEGSDQTVVFSFLAQNESGQQCVLQLKLNSFTPNLIDSLTWEVFGVLKFENMQTSVRPAGICSAKLIQTPMRNQIFAIVLQYQNDIFGVCVTNDPNLLNPPKVNSSSSAFDLVKSRTLRYRQEDFDPTACEETQHSHFGLELASFGSVQPLNQLLGKNGDSIYFVQEVLIDSLTKAYQVQRAQLKGVRTQLEQVASSLIDTNLSKICEFDIQTIFQVTEGQICFFELDLESEQNIRGGQQDAFFICENCKANQIKYFEKKSPLMQWASPFEYISTSLWDLKKYEHFENLLDRLKSEDFITVQINRLSFSFKNETYALYDKYSPPLKTATLEKSTQMRQIAQVRGTQHIFTLIESAHGGSQFIVKPIPSTRAFDYLGVNGPTPVFTSWVETDSLLFVWQPNGKVEKQSFVFDRRGNFLDRVGHTDETLNGLVPVQASLQGEYFFLQRSKGQKIEGLVVTLERNAEDRFQWKPFSSLMEFQNDRNLQFFMTKTGLLILVDMKIDRNINVDSILAKNFVLNNPKTERPQLIHIEIKVGNSDQHKKWAQRKLLANQKFLVLLNSENQLFKIEMFKFLAFSDFKEFSQFEKCNIYLPASIDPNSEKVGQFSLSETENDNLIQIQTPTCLLKFNIASQREEESLNFYAGCLDSASLFIPTAYRIPVASTNNGAMTEYFQMSADEKQVLCCDTRLRGRTYRLYSELNLRSLQKVQEVAERLESEHKKMVVDYRLSFCLFNGNSFFHMYHNKFVILSKVANGVGWDQTVIQNSAQFKQTEQSIKTMTNAYKVACFLCMRPNHRGLSALNLAVSSKNYRCFEILLNLVLNLEDSDISLSFLKDFKFLMGNESAACDKFFNEKFVTNQACINLFKVCWTADEEEVIIVKSDCHLTRKDIEKLSDPLHSSVTDAHDENLKQTELLTLPSASTIERGGKKLSNRLEYSEGETDGVNEKTVKAVMLDMSWLFEQENCIALIKLLNRAKHEDLFNKKQVTVFIDLMWTKYNRAIINEVFLHWMRYFVFVVVFMSFFLGNRDEQSSFWVGACFVIQVSILFDTAAFMIVEVSQIVQDGVKDYFMDIWNFVDLFSFSINLVVLWGHIVNYDLKVLRLIASLALLVMWTKLFYWMRLFSATASFIRMIAETISDIKAFLIMLIICVCMFANATFLMDQQRRAAGLDPVNAEAVGNPFADAIIRSYLVGMGEYDLDALNGQNKFFVWFLFLVAVNTTQLIFMNLLIAIMGDTYDRVSNIMEQTARMEKIQMIYDFIWVVDIPTAFPNAKCVFVVTQTETGQDNNSATWEGRLGKIRQMFGNVLKTQNQLQNARFQKLEKQLELAGDKTDQAYNLNNDLQRKFKDLSGQIKQVQDTQKKILSKLEAL